MPSPKSGNTHPQRANLYIEERQISSLKPFERNARTHSKKQIRQIAKSIREFGFNNPILIDDDDHIIAGHGRVEAAKGLNIATVPAVRLSHLNEAEKRAYVIADNRLAEKAGWDPEILAIELQGLIDIGFAVEITGFETPDIDLILEEFDDASRPSLTADDQISDPSFGPPVSRANDVWVLGAHRLLCGDARSAQNQTLPPFLRQRLVWRQRHRGMERFIMFVWTGGILPRSCPPDGRPMTSC